MALVITELQTLNKSTVYYSDIPASFAKSMISNDLSASYDMNAIQQSMVAIIKTVPGERPFNPEYGCNVINMLFENVNQLSAFSIKKEIETAIGTYEPRVRLKNVIASPLPDDNKYAIQIEYHLITDLQTIYATKFKMRTSNGG